MKADLEVTDAADMEVTEAALGCMKGDLEVTETALGSAPSLFSHSAKDS